MQIIKKFGQIIFEFDYFLFDLWGTIITNKNNSTNINQIFRSIKSKKNTKIFLVTNSSKPTSKIKEMLKTRGLKLNLIDDIYTSASYALEFFNNNILEFKKKKIFYHGEEKYLFRELKKKKVFNFIKNVENSDVIILSNKTDKSEKFIKNLNGKRKIYLINSDFYNIKNKNLLGFYLNKFYKKSGNIVNLGKPNLYNSIIKKFSSKKKIIIIGDSIYHDFSTLRKKKIKTLYVENKIVSKKNLKINILKYNNKNIDYKTKDLKL